MSTIDMATRSIVCKIVYYGAGLCGKTTNLTSLHKQLAKSVKGKLLTLDTKTERTLFFDFFPLDLGKINGFNVKFHVFTVPGQSFYNETRRQVLKGTDGVVFVADSGRDREEANVQSLDNLEENLRSHDSDIQQLPLVLQYNKRDLPNPIPIKYLQAALNRYESPEFEAVALENTGVHETQKEIIKLVLMNMRTR